MSWTSFLLLGDFGQQLDIHRQADQLRHLRSALGSQAARDMTQDDRLAALEDQNLRLRLYLSALIDVLSSRNLLTQAELEAAADRVWQQMPESDVPPPPEPPPAEPAESSADLQDLARAAQSSRVSGRIL
jgi:hypothetical protein